MRHKERDMKQAIVFDARREGYGIDQKENPGNHNGA